MNEPNKTKHIVDSRRLSFEPNMIEILAVYNEFRAKYKCLDSEVHLEEINERCVSECSDRYGCSRCDNGYNGVTTIVFSRTIPNANYEAEMKIWRAEKEMAAALEAQFQKSYQDSIRLEKERIEARKAWKTLHRQERVSRRMLGRHTMINTA